ncbi:MAG: YceI family protein, partial [Jiangellaceae bacterium]
MTETTTATNTRTWNGLNIPIAGTFALDAAHTNAGFVAKHMMVSKVRGKFDEITGTLNLADDPTQSTVEVSIKTASINTGSGDRDNHVRSADFFDVENYPELTFRSTKITHAGDDEFVVTGDLTIKDVTKPVDLKATFEGLSVNPWGAQVVGFSATTQIDREDWGLSWNAALETGGVLVSKKITIEIDTELNP